MGKRPTRRTANAAVDRGFLLLTILALLKALSNQSPLSHLSAVRNRRQRLGAGSPVLTERAKRTFLGVATIGLGFTGVQQTHHPRLQSEKTSPHEGFSDWTTQTH
jgi:hypothetical protein